MVVWLGIVLCVVQSATFSGLNLAVFSLGRTHLEAAAEMGDAGAAKVLKLRSDGNFTLVTILWGNVGVNVLLTLLADSILAGVTSFLFTTVVITIFCEITPQAYFSRHALAMVSRLHPVLRFWQIVLWPVARPTGKLLDRLVGQEAIPWFRETHLQTVLRQHARSPRTEIGRLEARGAINFLSLDDLPVRKEGEPLDPATILRLPIRDGAPVFPTFARTPGDPFLRRIVEPGKKWIVITGEEGAPRCVVNATEFLRGVLFGPEDFDVLDACYRPLVIEDPETNLGQVLHRLTVHPEHPGDDVIDQDLVLVWTPGEKRIISGTDLLGRLLRGISRVSPGPDPRYLGTPPSRESGEPC